jgi:hypothetical protein
MLETLTGQTDTVLVKKTYGVTEGLDVSKRRSHAVLEKPLYLNMPRLCAVSKVAQNMTGRTCRSEIWQMVSDCERSKQNGVGSYTCIGRAGHSIFPNKLSSSLRGDRC